MVNVIDIGYFSFVRLGKKKHESVSGSVNVRRFIETET